MELGHQKEVQDYIKAVCSQVRFRDIHEDLRLELEAHIQEIAEDLLGQGFTEKEAIAQAVAQMGNADIVGQQLNQVHKPKTEWSILLFSFLFINIGLLALYFIQQQGLLRHNINLFEKSLFFALISFIFIIGFYFFDYRKLEKYSIHIYLGTLVLLIFTVFWGVQAGGSSSWLVLGPFSINFVAVSPLLFSIALAGIFNEWDWNNNLKLVQGLALLALPLMIILMAPSLAAAAILIVAFTVLMIVSGAQLKQALLIPVPFIVILIWSIFNAPYRLERFLIFLNPGSDPQGYGYLNLQLSKIISHSGFLGQGLTFDPLLLPDLHTDFIFAFITYTCGWLASILLTALVIMFLVRMIRIAKQVKITYAKLLISGFVSILSVQFLWNIFMNLGLAPISGVGLPFISYGGSQLVINAAIIGIVLSIYRRKNISSSYKLS